jgi:hypothetical protein
MGQFSRKLTEILFPAIPRDFPQRRNIRTLLRALHILSAGTLLGGHIFDMPVPILMPWLYATIITGTLILITDLHATACVLFEIRGIAIIIKLMLMLAIAVWFEARVPLLCIILLIGVYGSHMPKYQRHKMLFFEKRFQPDQRNG